VFWFDLPGIFSLSLQDFPQPPVVELTLESLWSHKQHVKTLKTLHCINIKAEVTSGTKEMSGHYLM